MIGRGNGDRIHLHASQHRFIISKRACAVRLGSLFRSRGVDVDHRNQFTIRLFGKDTRVARTENSRADNGDPQFFSC